MTTKSLEDIFNALRGNNLFNKFKDYESLVIFISTNPSGKNITKLQELFIKSPIDYNLCRSDFFENIIIPLLEKNNFSNKKIIEYIFLCLKNEGNLTRFVALEEFFSSISIEENFNKFMIFLLKNEYVKNEKKNSIKTIIESYIDYHNNKIKSFKKLDAIKAIDILLKENEFLIHENILNKILNSVFNSLHKYILKDCQAEKKNKDHFDEIQKNIKKLIFIYKNNSVLSECSKLVNSKLLIIKQKIEDERFIMDAFNDIESKVKKLPVQLYSDGLEKVILINDSNRSYSDYVSIGNLKFDKNKAPILINIFNTGGIIFNSNSKNDNVLVQNIILRIVFGLPKGHVKILIIDENYGISFTNLLKLPKEIIGANVYYDDSMVLKLLEELKKRDSDIVFNKIKGSFNNLIEYNKVNDFSFEPIQIFLINNLNLLNDKFIKYINNQINTKSITGSYFIISDNINKNEKQEHKVLIDDLMQKLIIIEPNLKNLNYVNKSKLLDYSNFKFDYEILISDNFIVEYFNQERKNIEIKNSPKAISDKNDTIEGIKIEIGETENGEKVFLDISNESGAYHGFICGTTGSGKSVLLHQIITGGAKKYLANELQFVLLDYKEGTAFQCYEDLPHARVMAVDADIDFGLEALRFISKLIKERAELFKKYKCKDISDYRIKTSEKCPRLLIVIDEFQVLVSGNNGNRNTTDEIKRLLEDIVRLGRSFGIHILLATQTPSGVKWNQSTMENISIRIGLRMSVEAENFIFKHTKPIASQFTERYGKAIYNDKAGVQSKSVIFNIKFLEEVKIPLMVQEAVIDANKSATNPLDRTIYYANEYAQNPNPLLFVNGETNDNIKTFIGISASIEQSMVEINLGDTNLNNLLIIGRHETAKFDALKLLISSYLKNSNSDSRLLLYFEKDEYCSFFAKTFTGLSNYEIITDPIILAEKLINIEKENIQTPYKASSKFRTLVSIFGSEKLINFSEIEFQKDNIVMKDIIKKILKFGPNQNILTIFALNEIKNLMRFIGPSYETFKQEFEFTLSVQGIGNKSKADMYDTYDLSENMGILYKRSTNDETKLKLIKI